MDDKRQLGTGTTTAGTPGAAGSAWRCPVCRATVVHRHRPGRARVYCTNACRQRAYRWRLRRRRQLAVAPPPQRASTLDRVHALRAPDDLVTPLIDARGRRITACGTFARAALDRPRLSQHPWFFATTTTDRSTGQTSLAPTTCRRCTQLLDVPVRPLADVLVVLAATRVLGARPQPPRPLGPRAPGARPLGSQPVGSTLAECNRSSC